ncbi:DUF1090 domain-containing protein [Klebsiella aerogenes]
MKKSISSLLALTVLSALMTPALATQSGCDAKKHEIQRQLDFARQHNNLSQQAGLQQALAEVNEHCSGAGLQIERENKIAEKEAKVASRQQEYDEAVASGHSHKIEKHRAKLAQAKAELESVKRAYRSGQ